MSAVVHTVGLQAWWLRSHPVFHFLLREFSTEFYLFPWDSVRGTVWAVVRAGWESVWEALCVLFSSTEVKAVIILLIFLQLSSTAIILKFSRQK